MARTTRMIKAQCRSCGFTVRLSRKWLNALGPPLCPCNAEPLGVDDPDWDAEEWQRAQMESLEIEAHVLRERWVTLESIQHCASCRAELWHGESAHLRVYTVGREFHTEYTGMCCAERRHRGRHAA